MIHQLQLTLSDEVIELGEEIRGRLVWTPTATTKVNAATVTAGWWTEGRGDRDSGALPLVSLNLPGNQFESGQSLSLSFVLKMPLLAPFTYDGKLLRILWEVRAHIDVPWASDVRAATRFIVGTPGTRKRLRAQMAAATEV